jgi:hypothetical protein
VVLGEPVADRLQPGIAIGVVESVARRNLGDVGGGVKVIAIAERNAHSLCQRGAYCRFP